MTDDSRDLKDKLYINSDVFTSSDATVIRLAHCRVSRGEKRFLRSPPLPSPRHKPLLLFTDVT